MDNITVSEAEGRGTSHLFAWTSLMLLALVIELTPQGTGSTCGGLNR